ncbi:BA75_03193T0 [Komagataella pastoris]|uniref:BA75_03193T0 n=1 Tax=Komagataella pastoris TaxID=4922 RepID=A0A1B2JDL9_PICPA|nr:BA75_03193T0 [Komagataella pastoris]
MWIIQDPNLLELNIFIEISSPLTSSLMGGESLSIEETNKLRKQLGLKLLPVEASRSNVSTKDSISVEQTNKLRASIGLKPVTESKPESETENYEEYKREQEKQLKEKEIAQRLERLKSKASNDKLRKQGTLPDSEDSANWLENLGKAETETPVQNSKAHSADYTENDLKGTKVAHDLKDIVDVGEDIVLTLKDGSVLDDEDELEANVLVKKKQLEENLRNKLGEEKYDELDHGPGLTDGSFRLGDAVPPENERQKHQVRPNMKLIHFSDDELEGEVKIGSDYKKPVKMKKLKKKAQNKRKKLDEDEDINTFKVIKLDILDEYNEEDEYSKQLAASKVNRKPIRDTAELLAEKIEQNKVETIPLTVSTMFVDETDEFLTSLKGAVERETKGKKDEEKTEEVKAEKPVFRKRKGIRSQRKEAQETDEPSSENQRVDIDEKDDIKEEIVDEIENSEEADQIFKTEPENGLVYTKETNPISATPTQLNSSESLGSGLGATLKYLKVKPSIDAQKAEWQNKQLLKERERQLAVIERQINERLREQALYGGSGTQLEYANLSKKEKERLSQLEKQRDQLLKDTFQEEKLKNYNPKVNLVYTDEKGNKLSTKDAFKYMSHKFHGTFKKNNK